MQMQAKTALAAPKRLGDILVTQGVISRDQLRTALDQQNSTQQRLGTVLITNGWADEDQITKARAAQMDVPYIAVGEINPEPRLLTLVPFEVATRYQLMPVSIEETDEGKRKIKVAMVNPWDIEAIDRVQRDTRHRVEPHMASEGALLSALDRVYQDVKGKARTAAMSATLEAGFGNGSESPEMATEDNDVSESAQVAEEAPVIRFVNSLFSDALHRRASDIHIEPQKKEFLVRYRIDGSLQTVRRVPKQFLAPTTSRIKIMAEMDIAERRLPLDGRVALRIDGRGVDIRISTLPTQYGERIVMRILDKGNGLMTLDQLNFSPQNFATFNKQITRPHGIILVTGPTGSGKTTTLYAALNALKSPLTNILTCEDPIEYELEGISQSNVNERAGLTFARQLRAILRQDPDVVLVGEIRDAETAEIAFRAAMTGHLVLSTLHCNEAAGAVSRLLDMGVAPFLIASTLNGVVAQRLVRRLCPDCRRERVADADQRAMFSAMGGKPGAELRLYEKVGCAKCQQVGTRGRLAVQEVMAVSTKIHHLVMEKAETRAIRQAAMSEGMIPMIADGLRKTRQGLTLLDDVAHKVGANMED